MNSRERVNKIKAIIQDGNQEDTPIQSEPHSNLLKRDNSQPQHQKALPISFAKPNHATTSLGRNPSTSNPSATLPHDQPQSSRRSLILEFEAQARNSAFEKEATDKDYLI